MSADYDAPSAPLAGQVRLLLAMTALLSSIAIVGTARAADADHDGLDDTLEAQVLHDNAPYLWFAYGEDRLPCDYTWFLQRSSLEATSPLIGDHVVIVDVPIMAQHYERALSWRETEAGGADIASDFLYYPRMLVGDDVPNAYTNIVDDAYYGQSTSDVLTRGNVGLYGHVAPVQLAGGILIDVQYWQLFAFNDLDLGGSGNHEGDWNMFEALLDDQLRVVAQIWYHHGDKTIYQLPGIDVMAVRPLGGDDEVQTVSSLKTPTDVYVGKNDHEFYPYQVSLTLDPLLHYQTRDVPNIGEVPIGTPDFEVLCRYNGYWGDGGGINGSPEGIMKNSGIVWQWPVAGQVHVDGTGAWADGAGFPLGSFGNPFGTLSDALAALAEVPASSYLTSRNIYLRPGNYPGSMTIRDRVLLLSVGGGLARIGAP